MARRLWRALATVTSGGGARAEAPGARARTAPRPPAGILYLIGSFHFGGSERHLLEVVRRLDRDRFAPHIAVMHRTGELERAFEATGVPIQTIGIDSLLSWRAVGRLRALSAFARRHDVRIVHGLLFHGNLYGALIASRRTGRVLVTSERGVLERPRPHHQLARRFYHRRSRRMLVNSAAMRRYVETLSRPRDGWVTVIHNGTDTEHFDRTGIEALPRVAAGLPPGGVVVGHVGRFREEKGQRFLLQALRLVAQRELGVSFLIAGGGSDQAAVVALAAQAPLSGRTAVLDYQADVRPLLRAMDIFVLPSRTEGMPNVLLEAMSMGLACVSTRVGGADELLDGGAAGALVDYGDVEGLAAAILALVASERERERYGRLARRRAVERFSVGAMMDAYQRVYEEVLAEPCAAS